MPTTETKPQAIEPEKKKRHRSPNYPTVGLREAIERTKRFIATDGKAGAASAMAAKHIGFASAHGQAYSVLSALKKFGLIEDKDGRVVPTQRAMEIVSLPDSDERRLNAIRQAALSPQIYAEIVAEYKTTGLPHDETLAGELVAYRGFNPNSVSEFLEAFKETLEFAGLSDFSVLSSEPKAENEKPKPQVGDFVQWEHNGILGFPDSKRLTKISDDGQFGIVEGYKTGLPISEIILAEPPADKPHMIPPSSLLRATPESQGAKMRQDVCSLTEGEAVIHWPTPLSADSIADLEGWLDLVKRKIKRSASESVNVSELEPKRSIRLSD